MNKEEIFTEVKNHNLTHIIRSMEHDLENIRVIGSWFLTNDHNFTSYVIMCMGPVSFKVAVGVHLNKPTDMFINIPTSEYIQDEARTIFYRLCTNDASQDEKDLILNTIQNEVVSIVYGALHGRIMTARQKTLALVRDYVLSDEFISERQNFIDKLVVSEVETILRKYPMVSTSVLETAINNFKASKVVSE